MSFSSYFQTLSTEPRKRFNYYYCIASTFLGKFLNILCNKAKLSYPTTSHNMTYPIEPLVTTIITLPSLPYLTLFRSYLNWLEPFAFFGVFWCFFQFLGGGPESSGSLFVVDLDQLDSSRQTTDVIFSLNTKTQQPIRHRHLTLHINFTGSI